MSQQWDILHLQRLMPQLWVVILTGMANTITDENEAPYEQDGIAQGSR